LIDVVILRVFVLGWICSKGWGDYHSVPRSLSHWRSKYI